MQTHQRHKYTTVPGIQHSTINFLPHQSRSEGERRQTSFREKEEEETGREQTDVGHM